MAHPSSKIGMLQWLSSRFPQYDFGIRDGADLPQELVPPSNLWERIKQVFTGPVWEDQLGIIEIAILHHPPDWDERSESVIRAALREITPLTVGIRLIAFEK